MVQKVQMDGIGSAPSRLASHVEDLLDEALMETFPASDPVAICVDHVEWVEARRSDVRTSRKLQAPSSFATDWRG